MMSNTLSAADIAAIQGNNRGDFLGGMGGMDFILGLIFGGFWGGNGFGGNGFGGGMHFNQV